MKKELLLKEFKQQEDYLGSLQKRLANVFKNLDKVVVNSRNPVCSEEFTQDPNRCIFVQFNKNNQFNRNKQPYYKKNEVVSKEGQQAAPIQNIQNIQNIQSNTQGFQQVTGKTYTSKYNPGSKLNYSVFYNNDLVLQNKSLNVDAKANIFYYALHKKNVTMVEGPIALGDLNDILKCGKHSQELPIGVNREDQMTPANVLFAEDIKIHKQEKWNNKRKYQEEQQKQQELKEQEIKEGEEQVLRVIEEEKKREEERVLGEKKEKERLEREQKEKEALQASKRVNPLLEKKVEVGHQDKKVEVSKQDKKVEEVFFVKVDTKKQKNKKNNKKGQEEIQVVEKVTENTWEVIQPIVKQEKVQVHKESYPNLNAKQEVNQSIKQEVIQSIIKEEVNQTIKQQVVQKKQDDFSGFQEVKSKKQKKKHNMKKNVEDEDLKKLGIINQKDQKKQIKSVDDYPNL